MNQKTESNINWTTIHEVEDAESHLAIRVNRSNHTPRNRFSYQIGRNVTDRVSGEKRFLNYIPVFVTLEYAKVKEVNVSPSILSELLYQVGAFIQKKAQEQEDDLIERKIERERKGGFVEPETKPGLKTLSKRDKARRDMTSNE